MLLDIVKRLHELRIALLHHLIKKSLRITGASDHADHLPELVDLRHL